MFRTIPRYEEADLGLPYPIILIDSAEEEIDPTTGDRIGVSVPDMEELVATVAVARALIPLRLDGQEVRFMRQAIGMTASAFAEALDLDKATFSRWENNKQTVGGWADKQVRFFVLTTLRDKVPELSAQGKDVVEMKVVDAPPNHWPIIELRRVPAHDGANDHNDVWDTLPLAA